MVFPSINKSKPFFPPLLIVSKALAYSFCKSPFKFLLSLLCWWDNRFKKVKLAPQQN